MKPVRESVRGYGGIRIPPTKFLPALSLVLMLKAYASSAWDSKTYPAKHPHIAITT